MLAEIITIGDEILIGQIVDTNSAWMARQLNETGIRIKQISSVADEHDHILKALDEAKDRAGLILITGGLGPTKDDITKSTLCEYFNSTLVLNQEALENVKKIFEKFKAPLLEVNIKQAEVPHNCKVLPNRQGTAPGMWFEKEGRIYISMPGVPHEMMTMMEDQVLPELRSRLQLPPIVHHSMLTAGIGESFLAEQIKEVEGSLPPHIKLAYLPKLGQVRLRLSGYVELKKSSGGPDTAVGDLVDEVQSYAKKIKETISEFLIADRDMNLEEAVLSELIRQNKTLSTAESCTGGYISHLLTSIPGSSKAFVGGAVAYSYPLKEQMLDVDEDTLLKYGAVSEETVREMAVGALKNYASDYVIACSGIAGPEGGTPEKPVGTVWVAVGDAKQIITKKFQFGNKRMQNIERTAVSAMTMLMKMIKAGG